MIGAKSIYLTINIKSQIVKIQGDRNYMICDFDLPEQIRSIMMNKFQGRPLFSVDVQLSIVNQLVDLLR